jgi:murein DD-endopeptidase MepM/ murein hydrolase activator NlpD
MMQDDNRFDEPPIDPIADTNPSLTIQRVEIEDAPTSGWQRGIGLLSLLVAAGLTVATAFILASPNSPPTPPDQSPPDTSEIVMTLPPTTEAEIAPTIVLQNNEPPVDLMPTLSADAVAALLSAPPQAVTETNGIQVIRDIHNPFTVIPDRPRSEVIQYTAVQGDTVYTIADRFKLKPESIGWSNSRRIIQVLRPGDVLNVPPVDGIYMQVVGSRTIADYATEFKVSDPFVIIDSEFNDLFGTPPDTILPSGTWIFIPGGEAEPITWNPGVTVEESGPRRGYVSSFAPGDPGSCGNVQNPGGGAGWGDPLPGSTFVRGFDSLHTGVDLSASSGAPVRAANSGAVIFAGWNNWGYGNTVVLVHGPFLTLYGHLSTINVGCGQLVSVGQVIAGVGSTGNSSGPHLHFEIRNGNTPSDPLATLGGLGG